MTATSAPLAVSSKERERSIVKRIVLCVLLTVFLPIVAEAQQSTTKVPRIGYLAPRSAVPDEFIQGLREFGYVEGKNIVIEPRFAHGKFDQFPRLATQLARLNVDVLVTLSTPAAQAAKKSTSTIPIIMLAAGHPVDEGLVVSLARPGGNITGLTATTGEDELVGKRLECLGKQSLSFTAWQSSGTHSVVTLESFRQGRIMRLVY
jgi:putative ABC transport system substrate-binding protein